MTVVAVAVVAVVAVELHVGAADREAAADAVVAVVPGAEPGVERGWLSSLTGTLGKCNRRGWKDYD